MSLQKCTEALKQLTFTPTLKRKRIRSNSYRVVPLEFAPKGYDFYVSFGKCFKKCFQNSVVFLRSRLLGNFIAVLFINLLTPFSLTNQTHYHTYGKELSVLNAFYIVLIDSVKTWSA